MSAPTKFGRHAVSPKYKHGDAATRARLAELSEFIVADAHQWEFTFANGYGASVIDDGYGKDAGLYELAVIGKDGSLDYSTPITDDVLGWLTAEQVAETLDKIEALA